MNDKLGFFSYVSEQEHFTERNWKIGDEFNLPVFGRSTFTLTKRTEEELEWRSGDILTTFVKQGDGWSWNRILINWKAIAKVQFV